MIYSEKVLSPQMVENLKKAGVDIDLSLKILNNFNTGKYAGVKPVVVKDLPSPDGRSILDMTKLVEYTLPYADAAGNFSKLLPSADLSAFGKRIGPDIAFSRKQLETLGSLLLPLLSYGILNGGSATSYTDTKKNRSLDADLFSLLENPFARAAEICGNRPKGITPAYSNPDGSPGHSFLELKMRALLLDALRSRGRKSLIPDREARLLTPLTPMFQMTSVFTDTEITDAYRRYEDSVLLRPLIQETGIQVTRVETGVQPLISAFTHSAAGPQKAVFNKADGKDAGVLGLPGGHGQNFLVLKDVYKRLRRSGKRFVYLGNVDNIGFTPDPVSLALLALTGKQAGFDFAFKTAVDVKGGILVIDDQGRLNCADIGPAISEEDVLHAEASGKRILFNAATGLFNLDYLVQNIDAIIENLPMRWSDQDKDRGKYSQAEQVTWEVIGLLDDVLIFGVDKYQRFLAAKMLLESLMTSGIGLDDSRYPDKLRDLADKLHTGFLWNMKNRFGMILAGGRWVPDPGHTFTDKG